MPQNSLPSAVKAKDRVLRDTFVAHAEFHAVLASTNDRAAEAAREGLPLPLLIVADKQTAGRGRGGNKWWTGRESLAMSLAISPADQRLSHDLLPRLSLAAAVAVIETVRPGVDNIDLGLHWPNDVFAAGRKLSGILVECPTHELAIIGMGVNINTSLTAAPPEVRRRATSLWELTGRRFDRAELLVSLLNQLRATLDQLASAAESLGLHFDRLCSQRGETLRVRRGSELIAGRCQGIAADGALLLATAEGPRRIYSGVLVQE